MSQYLSANICALVANNYPVCMCIECNKEIVSTHTSTHTIDMLHYTPMFPNRVIFEHNNTNMVGGTKNGQILSKAVKFQGQDQFFWSVDKPQAF